MDTTNLPLFQAGTVEDSLVTDWTTLLELKINPDEEVYPTYIGIDFSIGNNQQIRILSNNEVLQKYTPTEGYIIMMFFNNELKFTTADKHAFVIQYKTDGVVGHEFSGEAQIIGVRKKIIKKRL